MRALVRDFFLCFLDKNRRYLRTIMVTFSNWSLAALFDDRVCFCCQLGYDVQILGSIEKGVCNWKKLSNQNKRNQTKDHVLRNDSLLNYNYFYVHILRFCTWRTGKGKDTSLCSKFTIFHSLWCDGWCFM